MILHKSLVEKPAGQRNPAALAPPPPSQRAPPAQPQQKRQVFPPNTGSGGGSIPMSAKESSYLKIVSSSSLLSNNIDVSKSRIDKIDNSNTGVIDPTGVVNNRSSTCIENSQGPVVSTKGEVLAQGFEEFVGKLDEAADRLDDDDHTFYSEMENEDVRLDGLRSPAFGDDHRASIQKNKAKMDDWDDNRLSFVSGKPAKDVQMNPSNSTVPMPAVYMLKNNRARMA